MTHKKKWLMFGVGLVVTVVALWYSTRQVVLKDFIDQLKNIDWIWVVPSALIFIYSMYLRSVRWGLLFRPHHDLKGYQVFRPLMICFGFNCILPGRVGEFARAWIVGKRMNTGVTTALATVVAERIIDAATLVGLLAFSLMYLGPMDPSLKLSYGGYEVSGAQFNMLSRKVVIASIVLVVGTILFILPLTQRILHKIISHYLAVAIPGFMLVVIGGAVFVLRNHAKGLEILAIVLAAGCVAAMLMSGPRARVLSIIQHPRDFIEQVKPHLRHLLIHFAQGFHALKEPWTMVQIILHSIVLWALIGVSNWVLAKGFDLHMNLAQSTAQMVIIAIFITIPAAPGYWGLFEAGGIFSAIVLGITTNQSLALAFTQVMHVLQILPILVLGLIFAWQLQMKPAEVVEIEEQAEKAAEQGAKKDWEE